MRKLLLASAAMVGASSSLALAQLAAPGLAQTQGQGLLQNPSPFPLSGANESNNYYGMPSTYKGGARAGTGVVPLPGTIVIKLNGKVEVDMGWFQTDANQVLLTTTSVPTVAGAKGVTTVKKFAVNPIAFGAFMRLYPAVDAMATNGLRYGASIELRQNYMSANAYGFNGTTVATPAATTALTPAGNTLGSAAAGASGNSSSETVFVRRAFAYLAADNVGIFRFGMTDGVIGLFDPCIFSSQCFDAGLGNFNGGATQSLAPGAGVAVPFVWLAQAGNEYDNVKIVYLSPQFFGIDVGLQYAPSMGNGYTNSVGASPLQGTTCNAAGSPQGTAQVTSGCISTTTGSDSTRWFNQVGVGVRGQWSIGPVDLGAYVFYETAGKASLNGPYSTVTIGKPLAAGAATTMRYNNLSFIAAATYITVQLPAGNLTYSADYLGGAINGQLNMQPTGGIQQNALLQGLLYRNGPLAVGAEYGVVNSQGAPSLTGTSQRHEWEVGVGASYNIAPGLYVVAEYQYFQRHQGAFDFITGAVGAPTNNTVKGQGITTSVIVNW